MKQTPNWAGFSKLSREDRFDYLESIGALTADEARYLKTGGLKDMGLAEKFVENVIGYFQIPLGVATNFVVDGRDLAIPMAVEETSIIAAASKTAKWVRENGTIRTESVGKQIIGQIQLAQVADFARFEKDSLGGKGCAFAFGEWRRCSWACCTWRWC